eukprot:scaffold72686_cov57-Phaeocystis_antarctica.AAC.1
MIECGPGGSYGNQTMNGLANMYAMLAVCYDTYGAKTESPYSSYAEVCYANEHGVRIIPLKLCSKWPPAPRDSDGKKHGATQNKFNKSAAQCARAVSVLLSTDPGSGSKLSGPRHDDVEVEASVSDSLFRAASLPPVVLRHVRRPYLGPGGSPKSPPNILLAPQSW